MRCESVYMSKEEDAKYFDFRNEEEPDLIHKVDVTYKNKVVEDFYIQGFPYTEKKERILEHFSSVMVYIPHKDERDMFTYIFQSISTLYDYAVSIRPISYPGKELIVIDYGTLSISEDTVKDLSKLIVSAVANRKTEDEPIIVKEDDEDEGVEIIDEEEVSDYPLPMMGSTEYDQDEFQIGVVEDDD